VLILPVAATEPAADDIGVAGLRMAAQAIIPKVTTVTALIVRAFVI
jgi:hypothetical protein